MSKKKVLIFMILFIVVSSMSAIFVFLLPKIQLNDKTEATIKILSTEIKQKQYLARIAINMPDGSTHTQMVPSSIIIEQNNLNISTGELKNHIGETMKLTVYYDENNIDKTITVTSPKAAKNFILLIFSIMMIIIVFGCIIIAKTK